MLIAEILTLIVDRIDFFVICLVFSGVISVLLSYAILRRIFNGMITAQIAFICNFAVMIFLATVGYLSLGRFIHFAFVELFVIVFMYLIYRGILNNRAPLLLRINQLPVVKLAIGISLVTALMIVLNQFVVPTDGSSRIRYMTFWWYSYLRLIITVVTPLGYFLAINLLESRKYTLSLLLTSALIVQSATSGSKAGFLMSILGMGMLHRDLNNSKIKIIRVNPFWAVFAFVFVLGSAVVVLDQMGLGLNDVLIRLLMNAEATIMVYLAIDPTEACHGVTLFAALHRGVARLFHDPSATNIDTLFGFALNTIQYGLNTFTGPNSSIPAYFSCNFPGLSLFWGVSAVLGYTAIVRYFLRIQIFMARNPAVWLLPFAVGSINNFPQDYYTGMSDLTIIIIVSIYFAFAKSFAAHSR